MDTELDRLGPPSEDDSEFCAWLDEVNAMTPEQAEAERIYWERRHVEAEYGTYVGDEEVPF